VRLTTFRHGDGKLGAAILSQLSRASNQPS
jgi:hypothetical protein